MLCAPVFIFTPGSSALLGCPRCGLLIWLSLLVTFNTILWVYVNFFQEKTDKTQKCLKSTIFVWYENGSWQLLDMKSINTENLFKIKWSTQSHTCSSSSGVKSFLMLKVLRISSGVFPAMRNHTLSVTSEGWTWQNLQVNEAGA